MYINSINNNGADYTLSSFGNIIVCSNDINDVKTVTFPNGFVDTNPEPYLTFQVLFVNGHNCVDSTTYMTLNDYNVMVNKNGSLINLPIHEFTESSNVVYKSLQANTILNLFFDGTQFVVIGNPIVLSSTDYIIYANGKIGDGNVGDIKASSLVKIPYGWLLCDGSAFDETLYPMLKLALGKNILPDLQDRFLQGANGNLGTAKEAGLPNIIGKFGAGGRKVSFEGAISNPVNTEDNPTGNGNNFEFGTATFNASNGECKIDGTYKSTSDYKVYGKSNTVQPASYTVNFIIKAK